MRGDSYNADTDDYYPELKKTNYKSVLKIYAIKVSKIYRCIFNRRINCD